MLFGSNPTFVRNRNWKEAVSASVGWRGYVLFTEPYLTRLHCSPSFRIDGVDLWNEYHEGTEIAESLQYGRRYIELSREYLAYFKQGSLPVSARSDTFGETIFFSAADDLGTGLTMAPSQGDGLFTTVDVSGAPAIQTEPMTPDAPASYLYFKVDNGFYFNQPVPITLSITYFDEGYEPLGIDYDTAPCGSEFNAGKMYRRIDLVRRGNTLTWKTATIQMSNATFAGKGRTSAWSSLSHH